MGQIDDTIRDRWDRRGRQETVSLTSGALAELEQLRSKLQEAKQKKLRDVIDRISPR
jgi:hypothetical protein